MDNLEDQVRELRQRTEANREEFLRTDLQTCSVTLDRARLELSLGNTSEAEKEFAVARHSAETIESFLIKGTAQLPEIESRLLELKASLQSFREELDRYPR